MVAGPPMSLLAAGAAMYVEKRSVLSVAALVVAALELAGVLALTL